MTADQPNSPQYSQMHAFRRGLEESVPQLENEIVQLGTYSGAADLFLTVAANILVLTGFSGSSGHGPLPPQLETLAYLLYPYFGHELGEAVPAVVSQLCMDALEKLCAQRVMLLLTPETGDEPDEARDVALKVRAYSYSVRGTAYPQQTIDKIMSVQAKFDSYFVGKMGVSPSRAVAVFAAIASRHMQFLDDTFPLISDAGHEGARAWSEARRTPGRQRTRDQHALLQMCEDKETAGVKGYVEVLNRAAHANLPVELGDLEVDGAPITPDEWDALIRLFGMTAERRSVMTDEIDVRRCPLYVMPDGRVLMPDFNNALDAVWDLFEAEARSDQAFYDGRYQKWKSRWLEERAAELLSRIFPADAVYTGVTYPDPDNPGGEAEADTLIHWGPFVVIVEGKAKQFRLQSELGDIARLSSDLAANVQDAFEQGRRVARYIDSTEHATFKEKATGRTVTIQKGAVRRIYLLALSLHQFAGLTTHLASLSSLRLFGDGEYPLAISVPDLDIVTRFCGSPDVFLHYVERRLSVQSDVPQVQIPDELQLFGAYLKTRLQGSRIWERDGQQYDSVQLDGFTERIDEWMARDHADDADQSQISLNVPKAIQTLLEQLRRSDDDGSRWIAFSLLDLPDKLLTDIDEAVNAIRGNPPEAGRFRRTAFSYGDTVVCIVTTTTVPHSVLYDRVNERALLEKYIRRASKCAGFGLTLGDVHPLTCAVWIEGPWERDQAMETLVQEDRPFLPVPGTRLPGPNKPCICGSGNKYKKCCKGRIERAKAERGGIVRD